MNPSISAKIEHLMERYEELERLLSDADVIGMQEKFRAYSKEYAELEPVVQCWRRLHDTRRNLDGARAMLKDVDPELRAMVEEEEQGALQEQAVLESELQKLLLPKDPRDSCNIFLEIRAGTGGDEAAIFSGDLYKMYSRYAESQGWTTTVCEAVDWGAFQPDRRPWLRRVVSRVLARFSSPGPRTGLAYLGTFRKPG